MWSWSRKFPEKKEILRTFFEKIAGKKEVDIGKRTYYMPINYKTNDKEVIANENLPAINLKNNNLQIFEDALKEYVETFFSSEKYWANPISSCADNEDKLHHALATIWLNATYADYEEPIQFIKRYTQFLKDKTFDEFYDKKTIKKIQTLRNCSIEISKEEQEEFQETPDAILFTIIMTDQKGNKVSKKLPRIAYGISDGVAYIYGIQGYNFQREESPEIKKVNRSRYKVNSMDKMPQDYRNVYSKQEPYAYISLFAFLCMLKEKGITKVVMPAFLPLRYEGKEIGLSKKEDEIHAQDNISAKEKKEALKEIEHNINEHQRVQYNITNKFLSYMARMECDVPGIEIQETPDQNACGLVVDISQMSPDEEQTIIFYEISKKIQGLMKEKQTPER
ncbi:MAG: hypothetical protein J6K45_05595 [Clostridia bacterium]|nr:hypothetical protein [Clostridia bacterium]